MRIAKRSGNRKRRRPIALRRRRTTSRIRPLRWGCPGCLGSFVFCNICFVGCCGMSIPVVARFGVRTAAHGLVPCALLANGNLEASLGRATLNFQCDAFRNDTSRTVHHFCLVGQGTKPNFTSIAFDKQAHRGTFSCDLFAGDIETPSDLGVDALNALLLGL